MAEIPPGWSHRACMDTDIWHKCVEIETFLSGTVDYEITFDVAILLLISFRAYIAVMWLCRHIWISISHSHFFVTICSFFCLYNNETFLVPNGSDGAIRWVAGNFTKEPSFHIFILNMRGFVPYMPSIDWTASECFERNK